MLIYNRRKFFKNAAAVAGTSMIISIPGISHGEERNTKTSFTVKDVIDIILKEVPDFNRPTTVDQLRSGSMEQEVTGIVTTMFPTIEVIEKTAKAGANFIIA
ncbi:MAG TPA: hypothetical protein VI461_16560, partial [Chitinophagaceae bacterium]|nr:hypothetical protein [Chitinophagaceae bacterium]